MEKEKLTEELTEKISGGVKVESKSERPHGPFESYEIEVKCAKCGKEFKYYKDGRRILPSEALRKKLLKKRTCPGCGYVNSTEELGI